MTISLYVDSGYWDTGYTDDITVNYVYSSSVANAAATILAASNYLKDIAGTPSGTVTVLTAGNYVRLEAAVAAGSVVTIGAGGIIKITCAVPAATAVTMSSVELYRTYPGVNLNTRSSTIVGANVRASTGGISLTGSSTKAGSRIFWENTQPVSGTWTVIVPQAEGTGE